MIAASKRKPEFSTEAGSRYLILGAIPSGILLFGYDRSDNYRYLLMSYIIMLLLNTVLCNYMYNDRIGYYKDVKPAELIGCDIDLTGNEIKE